MAEKKSVFSKALGIFVETGSPEPEAESETPEGEGSAADEIAAIARGAGVAPRGAPAPAGPPMPNLSLDKAQAATAPTDFDAIFRGAGMDASELDRVKKAEDLLKSLPAETPQAVKKQIVEASLKAFGFEIDKIIAAAQNQRRALDAYVKVNETATAKAITDAQAQIASFNEKIAALRTDIEKRTASLTQLSAAAQSRKGEVQKVLEFFQAPGAIG
jgi:hypothetical protein